MKINILYIGLILSLLSFSDCDFGAPSSIPIGCGSSGYGPSGFSVSFDTLNNVLIGLDTINELGDTCIQIKFNFKPDREIVVKNIIIRTRNVDPYIYNGINYGWDSSMEYTIRDFEYEGCYTVMSTYPKSYNKAYELNAVKDSTYHICLNASPFQFSGCRYQIEITIYVIPGSSITIGGAETFYYMNP